MNGELAHAIALATHGTAWLRTDGSEPAPDLADSSTLKWARSIEFVADGRSTSSVDAWLGALRAAGAQRLWLAVPETLPVRSRWPHLEPHMEVAFANGGHWFVLETGTHGIRAWHGGWNVIEPRPADNKIWAVHYEGQPAPNIEPRQMPLAAANDALDSALRDSRELANRLDAPEWAAQFDEALATSDSRPPYHPDMVSEAFPEDARRLLAKAARSWVFGGMGSWNDLGFQDEASRAAHAEQSRLLFATLLQACIAAVNCPLTD